MLSAEVQFPPIEDDSVDAHVDRVPASVSHVTTLTPEEPRPLKMDRSSSRRQPFHHVCSNNRLLHVGLVRLRPVLQEYQG